MVMNASNVTSFVDIAQYANTASEGWFGVGILASLFIIIASAMFMSGREKEGLATAAFITTLMAIMLRIINLIPNLVLLITIILFFVMVFFMFTSDRA
jgi:hypothetical protein